MALVVIGGSIAGTGIAHAARRNGWDDEIILVDADPHLPYDRPPLSKAMLAHAAPVEPEPLFAAHEYEAAGITLRLGVRAVLLDLAQCAVGLSDGDRLTFDRVVVATGLVARTLPGASDLKGIHTLRTAADALALRRDLDVAERVVIIGGGFIGSEVACAARTRALRVDIVEAQAIPMANLLGSQVAERLVRRHQRHGVRLHAGVGFARFLGHDRVDGVELTDGRVLPADVVVVGVGATPSLRWMQSSGLSIDDGLTCELDLRVVGAEQVFAAGDVARRVHPFHGVPMRVEHWTNANEHAETVAAALTGRPLPRPQPLYVWSDQYGSRIQIIGRPETGAPKVLRASADTGEAEGLVVVYVDKSGCAVGGVTVGDVSTFVRLRRAVSNRTPIEDIALADA
jgi:NADPH-dependent 2,4-dienoyl-CoA reductase/sulfur reductase-like enzyme